METQIDNDNAHKAKRLFNAFAADNQLSIYNSLPLEEQANEVSALVQVAMFFPVGQA